MKCCRTDARRHHNLGRFQGDGVALPRHPSCGPAGGTPPPCSDCGVARFNDHVFHHTGAGPAVGHSGLVQEVYTPTSSDTTYVGAGVTYSLKSGSGAGQSIDATSGQVSLTGNPDFETKAGYSFTVVATDAAGKASEKAVTLAINNVNEDPVITASATTTVAENSGGSTVC